MQNTKVVEFIKNPDSTVNDLINLYLLYLRAEQEKKNSSDGKTPNPFYLIYCFAHYECQDSPAKITQLLDSQVKIDALIKKYNLTLKRYYTKWVKRYTGKEYNDMIKAPIDIELLDECKIDVEELLALK